MHRPIGLLGGTGWVYDFEVCDRRAAHITFHFVVECYHVAFDIEIAWWQTVIVPSQSQPAVEATATAAIEETMKGRTNHVSCIPS